MGTEKKTVTKGFVVTITVEEVEEVEAPKVGHIPVVQDDIFSREAEEFFDEEDYSSPK